MSDARWSEIEGDFEAACTHFAGAARLFDAVASACVLAERLPECLRNFRNRIDPPET